MYPNYHNKYLFVSIGGNWPHDYRYRRYYRYGCHPNTWYGSQPYQYPAVDNSVTTNNYYYTSDGQPAQQATYDQSSDDSYDYQYNHAYDIMRANQENSESQQDGLVAEMEQDAPDEETLADIHFDNAVEAFAIGKYESAITEINRAMDLAPNDAVLPFTLSQGLFAEGRYTEAALTLREIFNDMPRDEETLYYPRGLYSEEAILDDQILTLSKRVEIEPFNGELNLLLAYHFLGTGQLDKVESPLLQAKLDSDNSVSTAIMQDLLNKAKENKITETEEIKKD